jgi:hypothetical protein
MIFFVFLLCCTVSFVCVNGFVINQHIRSSFAMFRVKSFSKNIKTVRNPLRSASSSLAGSPSSTLSYSDLPNDTLFVLDGTAMLYYAHYSNASRTRFNDALFSSDFTKDWISRQSVETMNRFQKLESLDTIAEDSLLLTASPLSPPEISSLSCSALSTMMYNFARFINLVHPNYLAIAFDSKVPTFRKELFDQYKKQRKKVRPFSVSRLFFLLSLPLFSLQ